MKKARKFAKKKYGEELPGLFTEAATMTKAIEGQTVCFVVLEVDGKERSQKAAILAHECSHVAQEWAAAMNEARPGDEFMAYAVQCAMLSCLNQLGDEWL